LNLVARHEHLKNIKTQVLEKRKNHKGSSFAYFKKGFIFGALLEKISTAQPT
jgi:hypothetical protein